MNTWEINGRMMNEEEIVAAMLAKNNAVTGKFLFDICEPLFTSVYNKYYTDCRSVSEFVSEIFLYLLEPKKTGGCRLSCFSYKCSLPMWLKVISENYCRRLYSRRVEYAELNNVDGDRFLEQSASLLADDGQEMQSLVSDDVERLLEMMPNKRYSTLIRLRYVEGHTNEETAKLMGIDINNFYNRNLLAKKQFVAVMKKDRIL